MHSHERLLVFIVSTMLKIKTKQCYGTVLQFALFVSE